LFQGVAHYMSDSFYEVISQPAMTAGEPPLSLSQSPAAHADKRALA
jgi:hypothetical protein